MRQHLVVGAAALLLAGASAVAAQDAYGRVGVHYNAAGMCGDIFGTNYTFLANPAYLKSHPELVYNQTYYETTYMAPFFAAAFPQYPHFTLASLAPKTCAAALRRWVCGVAFMNYNLPPLGSERECASVCYNGLSQCAQFFTQIQGSAANLGLDITPLAPLLVKLTNCTSDIYVNNFVTPSATCNTVATGRAIEETNATRNCPDPLIRNPFPNGNPNGGKTLCVGDCCASCPINYSFFKPNAMVTIETASIVIHFISFFGALFVFLSYALFPQRRKYPSTIILCFAFAITIIHLGGIIIARRPNDIFCTNDITESTMDDNGGCVAQMIFYVFGFLSGVTWFAVLVFNLHLIIVWKNDFIRKHFWPVFAVAWIIPIIAVILPLARRQVSYVHGAYCIINSKEWLQGVIFIPIAVVVFSAFIINGSTLIKIGAIASKAKKNESATSSKSESGSVWRLQLRPFLFSLLILFIFFQYWMVFIVQINRLVPTIKDNETGAVPGYVYDWIKCVVLDQLGQTSCAERIANQVPEFHSYFFSEVIVSSVGIWITVLFGIRPDILQDWAALFRRLAGKDDDDAGSFSSGSSNPKASEVPRSGSPSRAASAAPSSSHPSGFYPSQGAPYAVGGGNGGEFRPEPVEMQQPPAYSGYGGARMQPPLGKDNSQRGLVNEY